MKYRKILVPLDGSTLAERALPYAETLARCHGSQLVLVRAVEAPHVMPGREYASALQQLTREAEAYLARWASRLADACGLDVEISVYCGPAGRGIVEEIDVRGADLVAMSTHGRSGLGRLIVGSVADHVLRHAPVPVMLVPAGCDRAWRSAIPNVLAGARTPPSSREEDVSRPFRVLVPLDGSRFAAEALDVVPQVTAPRGTELILVAAVDLVPSLFYAAGVEEQQRAVEPHLLAAKAWLEAQAARPRGLAASVEAYTAVGPAARTIGECARDRDVDLVVMATHGRGGVGRLVLGSVATGVLHLVRCPLLLVRPSGIRATVAGLDGLGLAVHPASRAAAAAV